MQVFELTYPLKERDYEPSIVAIGFFDGVHLGHQKVIKRACEIARSRNLVCGVMTFDPHPKQVMGIKDKIDQITPIHSKLKQLETLHVDFTYIIQFTKEFANISPEEFVENILLKLNVRGIVVGFDFTFGYKGLGTPKTLVELSQGYFTVDVIDSYNYKREKISSTRVRDRLLSGDIHEVRSLLGRNYSFYGRVVRGDQLGRTIGFPTANLELLEDYLILKNGVYVVKVNFQGKTYPGVMNIGYKPTVKQNLKSPTYEVHLIDFDGDLYGQILEVELLDYIRGEKKFSGIHELKEQIYKDTLEAKKAFVNIER
ncbi:bifunctional riboflavin kinase/FAD synthetase [Tepidibacillus fermentans]|uniref:Riboflavin biosynthesis protein n=1 Tax=Tepidibacillus fermentans TaxID=1281767 RepID=A0A4R3KHV9_9BACI|nr:bifunctional riboflavin kinase/FAD synthetase [Tepidibacillus fermentans]TCS82988.1 riboflavin kinase/FMN adenylyltransferase [Tepidibacillus fermentans]